MSEISKQLLLKKLKELNEEVTELEASLNALLLDANEIDYVIKQRLLHIGEIEQELREQDA